MIYRKISYVLVLFIIDCVALVPQSKRSAPYSSQRYSSAPTLENDDVLIPVHDESDDENIIIEILAGNVARCLALSDAKRNSGKDGASAGWTSWVDEGSAFRLQCCLDKIGLTNPLLINPDPTRVDLLDKRDEAQRWIRWMKNVPAPMMIEISDELRQLVNATLDDVTLQRIQSERDEFLERIGCRMILLPSGQELTAPIRTPAGAMSYGKLLYGGVARYRMIGGGTNKRRAGERTEVYTPKTKAWLQYGGPERLYTAIDMGPCALLEVLILPKGLTLTSLDDDDGDEMALTRLAWDPLAMFEIEDENAVIAAQANVENRDDSSSMMDELNSVLGDTNHVEAMESSFQTKVGGLSTQVEAIVRRVLDGRVIRPASDETGKTIDTARSKEAEAMLELGLQPVKGLLLFGPPGCGKTALAREISNSLDARPPKIVSAPELLDRWVGGSEKLVRSLFADADLELKQCNGDTTRSALHVIVIDEIDAVFRKRSSAEDSGEVTRASAVNQILSMLDGINSPGNILVIGMTNRRELLDDALLRPGRLEVQVEIPLPDQEGRREILQIHFDALRRKGRLSKPLCQAIDGVRQISNNQNDESFWRRKLKRTKSLNIPFAGNQIKDLASGQWTSGFSGADCAGLVRSAGSIALARVRENDEGLDNLLITVEDVVEALREVKQ